MLLVVAKMRFCWRDCRTTLHKVEPTTLMHFRTILAFYTWSGVSFVFPAVYASIAAQKEFRRQSPLQLVAESWCFLVAIGPCAFLLVRYFGKGSFSFGFILHQVKPSYGPKPSYRQSPLRPWISKSVLFSFCSRSRFWSQRVTKILGFNFSFYIFVWWRSSVLSANAWSPWHFWRGIDFMKLILSTKQVCLLFSRFSLECFGPSVCSSFLPPFAAIKISSSPLDSPWWESPHSLSSYRHPMHRVLQILPELHPASDVRRVMHLRYCRGLLWWLLISF